MKSKNRQLTSIAESFKRKTKGGKLKLIEMHNGFHIVDNDYSFGLFLPLKVGSIQVRKNIIVKCGYKNISFFKTTLDTIEAAHPIINDWMIEKNNLLQIKAKHKIEVRPGIEFLDKDIKLYINWKWESMSSQPNPIDGLSYRPLFNLLKNSELSKLFPVFHAYTGLSVSKYIGGSSTCCGITCWLEFLIRHHLFVSLPASIANRLS